MKIKAYAQLVRPYAIFMATMPILGAISNGIFENLLLLLLMGIFANMFGMVENDYFDIEIDKKSQHAKQRPLAMDIISKKEAIAFMLLLLILSIIISLYLSIYSFIFLLLYFLFYTIYNKFSKKYAFMEYSLGIAGSMIFLAGAFSGNFEIFEGCLFISFLPILKYAFNVGISANLKDLKYDLMQDVRTTPAIFGVNATIPKTFILYSWVIKFLFIFVTVFALCYFYGIVSSLLLSISILALIYTHFKIFENIEERKKMLYYAEIHEIFAYISISSILYDYTAIKYNAFLSFSLVILPTIWIIICIKSLFGGKPFE